MTQTTMSEAQWTNKERQLKGAITKARNKVPGEPTLADKIKAKQAVKDAEEALRKHRLNKFVLVG